MPTNVRLVKAMVFSVVMYGCESWTVKKAAAAAVKSLQSCPTLHDPMDCSLPGSSIHGIFQARVLEWRAITFSVKKAERRRIDAFARRSNQSWVFFGRTDAKAETPVLWPPNAKSLLIGKDSDAGKDWGQEEKGTTEDEIAGSHHGLD